MKNPENQKHTPATSERSTKRPKTKILHKMTSLKNRLSPQNLETPNRHNTCCRPKRRSGTANNSYKNDNLENYCVTKCWRVNRPFSKNDQKWDHEQTYVCLDLHKSTKMNCAASVLRDSCFQQKSRPHKNLDHTQIMTAQIIVNNCQQQILSWTFVRYSRVNM